MDKSQAIEIGWLDRLKNSLQIDTLSQKLNFSKHTLLDMALFGGIGFLIGFLWKRYANYVIAVLIFVAVVLLLQQLDLLTITINWPKLEECCGVAPANENLDIMGRLWNWGKMNIFIIFSFIIGFCFGAKVS